MPTKEETNEFFELLKRRYPEIVSLLRDVRVANIIERNESGATFSDVEDEPESEGPGF
jgi:hypothetical protein